MKDVFYKICNRNSAAYMNVAAYMKKGLIILLIIEMLFGCPGTAAAGKSDSLEVYCPQNRQGCLLLQMIMEGLFDEFDREDTLSSRVLAAAFPQLEALTEEDFRHYLEESGEEADEVREEYYEALANCLLAELLTEGSESADQERAQKILMLFLYPESQENADYQIRSIRGRMTGELEEQIAAAAGVGKDFVHWIIAEDRDSED